MNFNGIVYFSNKDPSINGMLETVTIVNLLLANNSPRLPFWMPDMCAILHVAPGDFIERVVRLIGDFPFISAIRLGISYSGIRLQPQTLADRIHLNVQAPLGPVKIQQIGNNRICLVEDMQSEFRWFYPQNPQ
ncbi:hypothetical protein [Xenorhabdus beddingii]|nr:hypothetical protein [Xenorhabdus beddingii]